MGKLPKRYIWLIIWLLVVLILDQISKWLITSNFTLGQSLPILPNYFNLTLVHNPGAAFGLFASAPEAFREPFFFAVPLLTLAVILFLFHRLQNQQTLSTHAFAGIIAGAIGNLVDRFRFGYVVDFLDFHWRYTAHFPAFNVADSAISIGVALLLLASFLEKPHAANPA